MRMDKKGGIGYSTIAGVGGLILVTIIALVVVSTMMNANLLRATATTFTVTNEAGHIDSSAYQLKNVARLNHTPTIISAVNSSVGGLLIAAGNYTYSSTGAVTNSSSVDTVWAAVNFNYTYIGATPYELSAYALTTNMTTGISDGVASKVPTIMLIAAIVLLLGVIVLLVQQARNMGWGSSKGSL